jgi:hypothetical protein
MEATLFLWAGQGEIVGIDITDQRRFDAVMQNARKVHRLAFANIA